MLSDDGQHTTLEVTEVVGGDEAVGGLDRETTNKKRTKAYDG